MRFDCTFHFGAWSSESSIGDLPVFWHCMTTVPWPAISDIWLGVRTVPVLSVAKEVAAPARSPTGRGAPEHTQVDAD